MKKYLYLLTLVLVVYSCSSDDDNNEETMSSVENFANPEIIAAIEELGFTIHEGTNPPNIEGQYQISQRNLEATNIPNDFALGTSFFRINLTFNNQDNNTLKVDFLGQEIDNNDNNASTIVVDNFMENSFISGSGNLFSVFFKVNESNGNNEAQLLYAFSGEITEDGISGIQNALFMLNNFGQDGIFIANNTGRILNDSDGLAQNLE